MNFRDLPKKKRVQIAKKGRAALGDKAHVFTKSEAQAAGKKSGAQKSKAQLSEMGKKSGQARRARRKQTKKGKA
jgi:hypothetical protein